MLDSEDANPEDAPQAAGATRRSQEDVARRLNAHERRLSALEAMSMQVIGELKGLRIDLKELGTDMRQVVRTLAETAARQPLDYREQLRVLDAEKDAREELANRVRGLEEKHDRRDEGQSARSHGWAVAFLTAGAAILGGLLSAAFNGLLQRALGH